VLIRRWDADLARSRIVPVAALAAIGPAGKPVISVLADEFWDGDLDGLIAVYLRAVIDWQVTLWLRHGIALEAHPQNVLIAVDRPAVGPRLRLLVRDLDSARIDLELITGSLGPSAPTRAEFADRRLACTAPSDLADLFVSTSLHQCVAAMLIDVASALGLPPRRLLDRVRPQLLRAAARHPDARDAALLGTRILTARRLPVKRALTAATLLPKTRTGAVDVNKYYGADAPSYL
jgi:siderophore synthetase component